MADTSQTGRARTLPTAAGFGAIVFWSTTVAFARSRRERIGPIASGAIVYLIAGSVGCVGLAAKARLARDRLLFQI